MEKLGNLVQSPTQLTATSPSSTPPPPTNMPEIARLARLLVGCYRTGDANDPEVYIGAVIAVLSRYPVEIVKAVVDPCSGIPSQIKWLPSIQEIKAACEDEKARTAVWRDVWTERSREQLAERKRLAPPSERRQTFAEIKAEMAGRGVHLSGPRVYDGPTADEVRTRFNVSQEQWDAIPDHGLEMPE